LIQKKNVRLLKALINIDPKVGGGDKKKKNTYQIHVFAMQEVKVFTLTEKSSSPSFPFRLSKRMQPQNTNWHSQDG
jgi:hypothetical protein